MTIRSTQGVAASYSRYSSDMQESSSLDQQKWICRDAAGKKGHEIEKGLEFSDAAVSGTKLNRVGLDAMLAAAAKRTFSVLYLQSLSRLARESVITMPMLKRLVYLERVRVISVSEGIDSDQPGWDLIAHMLSIQHERYIAELAANVHRGQVDNICRQLAVGDHCFGFTTVPLPGFELPAVPDRRIKVPKVYAIDPTKASWVVRIFDWFVFERRSIRWIVRQLNQLRAPKDHRSKVAAWGHQRVVHVLRNLKYVGVWTWGRMKNVRDPLTGKVRQEARPTEEAAKWTRQFPDLRLIEQETFEAAQHFLDEQATKQAKVHGQDGKLKGSVAGPDGRQPAHLLAGLMVCGHCGHRLYVGGPRGKYLFCPRYQSGECDCGTMLRRDRAERLILSAVQERIVTNAAWISAVYEATKRAWAEAIRVLPDEQRNTELAMTEIERKIERLLDCLENGSGEPDIEARLAQRRREQQALKGQLAKLARDEPRLEQEPTVEWVQQQLSDLSALLADPVPAAAHALRDLVGGQIVVEEIRVPNRQRHFLRGRFTLETAGIAAMVAGQAVDSTDGAIIEKVVIDFVDTSDRDAQAEQAMRLYEEGWLQKQIAAELGRSKAYVTKLLHYWAGKHGVEIADGRSRRSMLEKQSIDPPLYQRIAEEIMERWDDNVLLEDIAQQLGYSRHTITAAVRYWHVSRGLPVPDGRTRRKSLEHKSRPPDPALATDTAP